MSDNRATPATRGDTAILPTLYALRLAVLRYAQAYADRRDAPTKVGDQRVADAEQEWTDMHAALYAAATAEAGATGDECQCEACRTGPFRSAPATRDAKAAWAGITNEEAQRVAAVERGVRETRDEVMDEEVGRAIQLFRGFHDFPVSKVRMDYDGAPMRRVLEDFVSARSGRRDTEKA